MKRVLAVVLTWFVLAALSAGLGLVLFDPLPDYRLNNSGVPSEGFVTALEPTNHQIVRYSYNVGGREYAGVGHGGHGNPRFEDIRVGQKVLVFYDPNNPQYSSLGHPSARLSGNLWVIVLMSLTLPIFIIGSLYRMGFYRRSENAPTQR